MARVFVSYSHKDEDLRKELEKHLTGLRRNGIISSWDDRCIRAGEEIHDEISVHLNAADIILLLVSADFLASNYCYEVEMEHAMKRHEEGTASVIPVILRPCYWHESPFGNLKAIPTDGTPVVKHESPDDGLLEVAQAVREVVVSRSPSTRSELGPDFNSVTQSESIQQKPRPKEEVIRNRDFGKLMEEYLNNRDQIRKLKDQISGEIHMIEMADRVVGDAEIYLAGIDEIVVDTKNLTALDDEQSKLEQRQTKIREAFNNIGVNIKG
ncbi:MAG: toll/interleukin-1 receptor domain-containing protein [Caldilineaceae bacterium SB0662_bin_9]|uniref:Toll/interleukin-1 receptor domain-containing protein n=1 Tax=Caldilineaceae bacterium SB0662_bin_9 TaxID=2605258 RepID=A0A6B1DRZ5_9CHLR|nr:toll/interleukin-1 receptor domain-containing protein [Caldilineaceae bacterium SB0662_bin_9]